MRKDEFDNVDFDDFREDESEDVYIERMTERMFDLENKKHKIVHINLSETTPSYFNPFDINENGENYTMNVEALIQKILQFIDERAEEDGEPPDNDTILEGLGLSDDFDEIIDEAYKRRWGIK